LNREAVGEIATVLKQVRKFPAEEVAEGFAKGEAGINE